MLTPMQRQGSSEFMGKRGSIHGWEGIPTGVGRQCPDKAVNCQWILTILFSADGGPEGLHFLLHHWNQGWRRAAGVHWRHIQRRCRWGSRDQWCCRRRQCHPHNSGKSQLGTEVPEGGGASGDRCQPHIFLCSTTKLSRNHSQCSSKIAPSSVQSFCKLPGPRPPFLSHLPPSTVFQSWSSGHPGLRGNYQISLHFLVHPVGSFQVSLVFCPLKGWAMDWLCLDPEWCILQKEDIVRSSCVYCGGSVSSPVLLVGRCSTLGWPWISCEEMTPSQLQPYPDIWRNFL